MKTLDMYLEHEKMGKYTIRKEPSGKKIGRKERKNITESLDYKLINFHYPYSLSLKDAKLYTIDSLERTLTVSTRKTIISWLGGVKLALMASDVMSPPGGDSFPTSMAEYAAMNEYVLMNPEVLGTAYTFMFAGLAAIFYGRSQSKNRRNFLRGFQNGLVHAEDSSEFDELIINGVKVGIKWAPEGVPVVEPIEE